MSGRRIEVVPYDAAWPQLFSRERDLLLKRIAIPVAGIHHIGSTSVQGLKAKPVIDILLEVVRVEHLDQCSEAFISLGYECKGEYGIPGRRYYQKGGDSRTHQIHAFEAGSDHVVRHIAFRDYLKAHPLVAKEYVAVKERAAHTCDNDIGRYCDAKSEFVLEHERLALSWWATRSAPAKRDKSG